MAISITEEWICEKVKVNHDHLGNTVLNLFSWFVLPNFVYCKLMCCMLLFLACSVALGTCSVANCLNMFVHVLF